jgi:hypothetical protein
MSTSGEHRTAKDWDKVRRDFTTSIMVDIGLRSLAQNLDGADWPLAGEDETPAKYIDLDFEELRVFPGLRDHPERVDQLIDILGETLAFDNPFGEMVAQSAVASAEDNPLLKTLTRLEIPTDFPIERSLLSADVKAFCQMEKIMTLTEFANFAQSMPPQVVVGGDFRTLLNALANVNEPALAALLPFRVGSKGLHLPEALGQLVDSLAPAERLALLKKYGVRLTDAGEKQAAGVDRERLAQLERSLQQDVARVLEFFPDEIRGLPMAIKEHGSLGRYLIVLGNLEKETLVARFLEPMLRKPEPVPVPLPAGKGGWWAALTQWFRR